MSRILTRRGIVSAAPTALLATAIPAAALASQPSSAADPIFAQIELHKTLLHHANTMPEGDDDPVFETAVDREEAAIQALGNMMPTTLAGAIAQLTYMAAIEGHFADRGSPLVRTVLSVAKGLAALEGRSTHA